MNEAFRPDISRRFLHWLDGERWCSACQDWTPFSHDGDHAPSAERKPRRRVSDSEHGRAKRRRRRRE